MKKVLALSLIATTLSLQGCGWVDRKVASLTGDASEVCHDGVVYLQFTSGVSVKYDKDTLQPSKTLKSGQQCKV